MKVPVYDIVNCGPRSRFVANGKVIHNSKGSSINLQNMKRGSFLRKSIMAPDGYLLCVGDLSQIEPRVLAWLAGYDDMLDIFRAGGDPYATFGSSMFGIPGMTRESNPLLRQSAKSALLGCFGRDTQVLTSSGYKAIVDVCLTDTLWDGVEWVQHQGLVPQGEKVVETAAGVTATPDHQILVQDRWCAWHEVHTNPILFRQALCSANSRVLTGVPGFPREDTGSTPHGCVVPAGTKVSPVPPAYTAVAVNAVRNVEMLPLHRQSHMGPRSLSRLLLGLLSASLHALRGGHTTGYITHGCVAVAVGRVLSPDIQYKTGVAPGVIAVPNARPSKRVGMRKATTLFARIENTATACLTASAPSLFAALTPAASRILTTAGGVLQYTLRGLKTGLSSFGTLSPSMAGISPSCNLTGRTTVSATNRATYASSPAASTWPTNARSLPEKSSNYAAESKPLKQRMQTYDIAMAGPRNRYTILTDDGPIIVHNCGYQLGWASFAAQLLVGFLGAPPVRYTKKDARMLGVTADDVMKFTSWKDNMAKMADIAHTCTDDELLIHCLAAKAIIDKYRAAAAPVKDFWDMLGNLIESSLIGGVEYDHKGVLLFSKGRIEMANGMHIRYDDLKMHVDKDDPKKRAIYTYSDGKGRTKLYPGKICNNVTQGTARILMSDGMLRVQSRYPILGTVHDELIALVPEDEETTAYPWVLSQMTKVPKWMSGIPLAADGGTARRYGEAKN